MGGEDLIERSRSPVANPGSIESHESAIVVQEGPDIGASAASATEGPTDDDIITQYNAIRSEEEDRREFVGEKELLSALADEYAHGSTVFQAKIQSLEKTYKYIRRARGDGNCFFRSFMFAYLEHLLVADDKDEAARILQRVEDLRKALVEQGYSELTFEDFMAVFVEQVESTRTNSGEAAITVETLLQRARDPDVSNYVVMFFRFLTACEIQRRTEFFEPFIMGLSNMTVQEFCRSSVEPMGEESDHVHITALTDALGTPVRVVYLDGSPGGATSSVEVNHHDFIPSDVDNCAEKNPEPYIVLLYRPGHYDILYAT